MKIVIPHWIEGKAWDPESGSQGVGLVTNSATGETIRHVPYASSAHVDMAVQAARRGFEVWHNEPLGRRAKVLFALREILVKRRDDLARLITLEHGKVFSDAQGEVQRGLEVVEFACGIPQLLKGEYSEGVSRGVDVLSIRQPLGVVAGITPFNFPAMVPLWMFPVAIACGNSFVLKPSERDPTPANFLAECLQEAGLPGGVFNVIHGDREAVEALLVHPDVAGVSFVGSTPVAKNIYRIAASCGKRVQALGGAKNHMVVLPDADLDDAADAAVSAGYGSAGERCMSISVVVVINSVGDALVQKIAERIASLRVADGMDSKADMGPLITGEHRDRVVSFVETGVKEGASLVCDGRDLTRLPGFFLGPCLFDRVEAGMTIYRDEIFGPVLSVVRTDSFNSALELVNQNPYGNGVAIFTRDGAAARRFSSEVEVGMVGVNVPIPVPVAYHSFGGWGNSLFGDTHVHGAEGIRFYTRAKVVTARWGDPSRRGPDLGFPQT